MKMRNRILSIVMCLCMVASLLPAVSGTARATGDTGWNGSSYTPSALQNGSFETPVKASGASHITPMSTGNLYWKTTGEVSGSPDGVEIVSMAMVNTNEQGYFYSSADGNNLTREAYSSFSAGMPDGTQFAELNCEAIGNLYQDVATTPGEVISWSLYHRGRWGNDTMAVDFGKPEDALVRQTPTEIADPKNVGSIANKQMTTGFGWAEYGGTYVVPAGQTTTRFQFTSISTEDLDNSANTNKVGNMLDNITFTTLLSAPSITVKDGTADVKVYCALENVDLYIKVDSGEYSKVDSTRSGNYLTANVPMTTAEDHTVSVYAVDTKGTTETTDDVSYANYAATTQPVTPNIVRETVLDLTQSTVSYKDANGETKADVSTTANITDTGEGWAWYVVPTCKLDEADESDNAVEIDGKKYAVPVLVLDNADIEVSSGTAITVPTATILYKGTNTVFCGDKNAIKCANTGIVTFAGSGILNATATSSNAIYGSGGVVINSGTIKATAAGTDDSAICSDGDIVIKDAYVEATATGSKDEYYACGIDNWECGGAVSIKNSTVIASGGSHGIHSGDDVTITDSRVTSTGSDCGLYAYKNLSINGASHISASGTTAIQANTGIAINNGLVIALPSSGSTKNVGSTENPLYTVVSGTPAETATSVTIGTPATTVYVNGNNIVAGGYWKNSDTDAASGAADDYNYHYDAATGTLTLKDAEITKGYASNESYYSHNGAGIYAKGGFVNLVLEGDSKVTTDGTGENKYGFGILVENGDLNISGTGTVTVGAHKDDTVFNVGIVVNQNGNFNMSSGTVTATGNYGGLNVYHRPYANETRDNEDNTHDPVGTPADTGCINFTGGTMNTVANSYGFACDGNLNITGTTANVTSDALFGIYADGSGNYNNDDYTPNNDAYINIEHSHSITGMESNGFATGQTQWEGSFFQGFGVINVQNGVLVGVKVKYMIGFICGDEDIRTETATVGDSITPPTLTAPEGKTLGGWYTEENGGGVKLGATLTEALAAKAVRNEIALYPNWVTAPSGGGSVTTPSTVTVPVSSNTGSTQVSATVSGGKASVTVTDKQLESVVSSAKDTGTVTVDVSGLNSGVKSATIPAKVVKAATEANGGEGLKVVLPTGSVALDATALASVKKDDDVTVSVEKVAANTLTETQQQKLADKLDTAVVVDVNVLVNGVKQSNFNGGKITVSFPYTPKAGEDTSKLTIWYIKDNGSIEDVGGHYDAATKSFVFDTTHLSQYVMIFDADKNSFTDVASSDYFYDAVAWAVKNGITSGKTSTAFDPDGICTRAEAVTFLWRASGSPEPTSTSCPFVDALKSAYYYKAVLWATEKGITIGTSATTFSPDVTVSRGQAMTFLWRTAGKPAQTAADPFTDIKSGMYYEPAILWAVSKSITTGTSTTTFAPDAGCTRAHIVTFLYRYMGK